MVGMSGDGGTRLDAPTCVPARYSLLSVAEVEDRPDGHWQAGVEYDLESCDSLFVVQACPALPEQKDKGSQDAPGTLSTQYSDPFTMVAKYECSTGGEAFLQEAWDIAETRLSRGEGRTLEQTFWSGKDAFGEDIRQSLGTDPDAENLTPTPGTAVDITTGLALLEEWAGENYPCSPIIHANRGIGVYLAERNLVATEASVLLSRGTGSRIAIGGGYGSDGPTGDATPDGTGWMYVTGSIRVVRGPVFWTPDKGNDGQALARMTNDIAVYAERTYAIEKDCITGAVLVELKSATCC